MNKIRQSWIMPSVGALIQLFILLVYLRVYLSLGHLESGVMMISALRHEDGCSQRLACKLGKMAKESDFLVGDTGDAIMGAVNSVLPERFNSFARSFKAVASEEDESSCEKECYRCISI